ncbi:DGD2 [Symbiodinium sp. KB8]|nr:DGD2 [Symbiodinium sp. KB8]
MSPNWGFLAPLAPLGPWAAAPLPAPRRAGGPAPRPRLRGFGAPARRPGVRCQAQWEGGDANVTEVADLAEAHTPAKAEEPWTLQQLISIVSGFIGSILSLNAYSQLREASKQREAIARVSTKPKASSSSLGSYKNARIVQQLGGSLLDAEAESPLFSLGPVPACTAASNLDSPGRHFTIITTAALPWRTGTAVNPLLRALYLAERGKPVILYLPFLEAEEDQACVFAKDVRFDTPEEQEVTVREWCEERAKVDLRKVDLKFRWYPAKYVMSLGSIFPTGDCTKSVLETDPQDVLILEEPEHLCWFHYGQRWPNLSHVQREGAARAYYLGKALYPKGWRELLDLIVAAGSDLAGIKVDGYGSGPDGESITLEAASLPENGALLKMNPGIDHADETIHGYGVLVNPSTTDVLCTVSVEALAMGKHLVLARHVSNRFFEQFKDRCHFFEIGDADSFVRAFQAALAAGDPTPLPPEQRRILTWDAAIDRLFESAEVRVLSGRYQRPSEAAASRLAYQMHFDMFKDGSVLADVVRQVSFGSEYAETPWDEQLGPLLLVLRRRRLLLLLLFFVLLLPLLPSLLDY